MSQLVLPVIFLLVGCRLSAQDEAWIYRVNPYNFIRTDLNEMHFPAGREKIHPFYNKLQKLLETGEGRVNIVHIGGSHIQAGSYTGQMRTRFQTLNGDMNAGWGFMFPYRISRTNSPYGYYIRYSGTWSSIRNVESRKTGPLGVGGISATTASPLADLTILLEKENVIDYSFDRLRLFYLNDENNYEVKIDSSLLKSIKRTNEYIDFTLIRKVDSLQIVLEKIPGTVGSFTCMGMETESAPNGVMYHSIGVNGAHVPAYLRCQLFEEQLHDLNPDLVILGIGINDAYGRRFSTSRFEDNYNQLILKIRAAAPQAAIVFTTNNDSYLYRRYVNKNGEKVRDSMIKMARRYHAGVWDMFTVMGGLNSIVLWQKNNLAQSDRIHFTREGYLLVADLFFSALINDFENQITGPHKLAGEEPDLNSSSSDGTNSGTTDKTETTWTCFNK